MRILHFNDLEHLAGAETAVRRLCKECLENGVKTKLVTKKEVGVLDAFKISNTKAIVSAYKPDIIHVHNTSSIGKSPFVVAKEMNIPVIWTLHDYRLLCSNTLLLQANMTVCENFDCPSCSLYQNGANLSFEEIKEYDITFVVASDYVKNKYSRILSAKRIYWDAQSELLNREIKHVENFCFLFGGRTDVEKGVEYVLPAISRLKKKYPEIKLIFAGDSRGYGLERLSKLYDIQKNVQCMGLISKTEYEQLMQNCFAVICASIWEEPFNLTLLEAMSMGKPVIATQVGGQSEVVGDAGIKVMPKSSVAVKQAIEMLLENKDKAHKIGKACREQAEKFQGCTKEYIELYKELKNSRDTQQP
jgi:glycosyltransferase involved in cell wall biosynthesis